VTVKLWVDIGSDKIIRDVEEANAHRVWDILNIDPTKRSSAAWFINEVNLMLIVIGTDQYVSCATVGDAQKSVWVGARVSNLWKILI